MEQIIELNWRDAGPDHSFLTVEDLDNCVTEKILRNTFRDPLISSSDEEDRTNFIDWGQVFNRKKRVDRHQRVYVPGQRQLPSYPKLSSLTPQQHYQILKVICDKNPSILQLEYVAKPTKQDYNVYEDLKPIYEKEQKEYIEWAKTLWLTNHCIRALRPKPPIENVYEARFKMKAHELGCYPKSFEMAAQIPLQSNSKFDFVHCQDLITVNNNELPRITCEIIRSKISVVRSCSMPEPCNEHPCKFILPTESSVTMLPKTEVERELGQYAVEHGARFIASESALKCLLELEQSWYITVAVCEGIGADGEKTNVVVLGSEFSIKRDNVLRRSYIAFKHLLWDHLVPVSEKAKILNRSSEVCSSEPTAPAGAPPVSCADNSSDEEDINLCIDIDEDMTVDNCNEAREQLDLGVPAGGGSEPSPRPDTGAGGGSHAYTHYECTCKETMFAKPAPRSYRKWRVTDVTRNDSIHIVVHAPHYARGETGEVVLEPIPEYQLELGAAGLSPDRLRSIALSLQLRKNASALKVRLDASNGEIVTMESVHLSDLVQAEGDVTSKIAGALHTTLEQLQGLLPGRYLLHHNASHGPNALLYSAARSGGAERLVLHFEVGGLAQPDESASLKTAPPLSLALLPIHKYRKILPCAFTPFKEQLPRQLTKPCAKNKTPPQAIKWPPRRRSKRKTRPQ